MNYRLCCLLSTWAVNISVSVTATAVTYKATVLPSTGFSLVEADRISGAGQVGRAVSMTGKYHALFWPTDTSHVVDLNPVGFDESYANDISGMYQVGMASGAAT